MPGIWQSGSPQPGEHWDAVIDLDGSAPPLDGIALYVHWLIEDGPAPERAVLLALADLVNDLRRARKRVLIHCAGGINRTAVRRSTYAGWDERHRRHQDRPLATSRSTQQPGVRAPADRKLLSRSPSTAGVPLKRFAVTNRP